VEIWFARVKLKAFGIDQNLGDSTKAIKFLGSCDFGSR